MSQQGCGCGGGSKAPDVSCAALSVTRPPAVAKKAQPDAVPELGTRLTWRDRLGGWGVRWGINRAQIMRGGGSENPSCACS